MPTVCRLCVLLLVLVTCADGQSREPGWKGIHFRGVADGCWTYNANHPAEAADAGQNELYNFNDKANRFNPTLGELGLDLSRHPVGATLTMIFGQANQLIHNASSQWASNYVEQAFLSFWPGHLRGTQLDFGQFVTSAGAEVIEPQDDWNYSRSLLFSLAIPYYHFGMRATAPVTKTWTAGFQVVNGWNTIAADNGGLTLGLTSSFTQPKYGWSVNGYTGPIHSNGEQAYRNLVDSTLVLTPTPGFSAYLNYDYGQNRVGDRLSPSGRSAHWQGIATAVRRQLPHESSIAARYEYFSDGDGFTTGKPQSLNEATLTFGHKWRKGLLSRLEYRRDWSDEDFFIRGASEAVKTQSTATVALIAYFGSGQ